MSSCLSNISIFNEVSPVYFFQAPVYYPQAASNVRVTGSEIADINEQLNPAFSYCVGHSLGAQCCGHTGKRGAPLDRITGLK